MRDAPLNWPARVSGQIAAAIGRDPHLAQTLLQEQITALLAEMADRFDPPQREGDAATRLPDRASPMPSDDAPSSKHGMIDPR
jgi:hypothetical protein